MMYYTNGSHQNIWCGKCYSKLKDNDTIILDDGSETKKSRLYEAKNDSNPEETWVRCDGCKANVHQICALTSDRIRDPSRKFLCPKCDLKSRSGMEPKVVKYNLRADDLQRCEMSDSMEEGLTKILQQAYELKAKQLQIPIDEIEKAEGLSIRVLSHITKKQPVRDEVRNIDCDGACGNDTLFCKDSPRGNKIDVSFVLQGRMSVGPSNAHQMCGAFPEACWC